MSAKDLMNEDNEREVEEKLTVRLNLNFCNLKVIELRKLIVVFYQDGYFLY